MEKNSFENDNLRGKKKRKKVFVAQKIAPTPNVMVASGGTLMKKVGSVSAPPKSAKKKKRKKLLKKVGAGIAKVAKATAKGTVKGIKAVGKLATKATLLPLVPLMPVMGAALKRKGIAPPKGIEARAELFYNKIVRGANFEQKEILFTGNSLEDNHLAVDIVEAIVKYIKGAKARKKSGVTLDPVENIVVNGTDKVMKKISKKPAVKKAIADIGEGESDSNIKLTEDEKLTTEKSENKNTSIGGVDKKIVYGGVGIAALVLLVMAFKS